MTGTYKTERFNGKRDVSSFAKMLLKRSENQRLISHFLVRSYSRTPLTDADFKVGRRLGAGGALARRRVMGDALSARRPGRAGVPACRARPRPGRPPIARAAAPEVLSLDARLRGGGAGAALRRTPRAAAAEAR
jgi:hypothetical protein